MSPGQSFRVLWSSRAINAVKELGDAADQSASKKDLARVLRTLDDRLRRDPASVGEVYRVRGPIEEYLAVQEFVAIDFAFDKDRKLVLVRDCRTLSGRGF